MKSASLSLTVSTLLVLASAQPALAALPAPELVTKAAFQVNRVGNPMRITNGNSTVTVIGSSVTVRSVSADARYTVFESSALNLIENHIPVTNFGGTLTNVFLHDAVDGSVKLVSGRDNSTNEATGGVGGLISGDNSTVIYGSSNPNVLSGVTDTNGRTDVFAYNISTGARSLISGRDGGMTTANAGLPPPPNGNPATFDASTFEAVVQMDATGRYVVFSSTATNQLTNIADNNNQPDLFLHDRVTGTTRLITGVDGGLTTSNHTAGILNSRVAADGSAVAFTTTATNYVTGVVDPSSNNTPDIYLWRRSTGMAQIISRSHLNRMESTRSLVRAEAITADASHVLVAMTGNAHYPSGGFSNTGRMQLHLWNVANDSFQPISFSRNGATTSSNGIVVSSRMSPDGRYIGYVSTATDVVTNVTDSNGANTTETDGQDVFLLDRNTSSTRLVSRSSGNANQTADVASSSIALTATIFGISNAGQVLFSSPAENLAAGVMDFNGFADVFLYDNNAQSVRAITTRVQGDRTGNFTTYVTASLSNDGQVVSISPRNGFAPHLDFETPPPGFYRINFSDNTPRIRQVLKPHPNVPYTSNTASYEFNQHTVVALSQDGGKLLYLSNGINLVENQKETNSQMDLFLYDRASSRSRLLTRNYEDPTQTAEGSLILGDLSADGRYASIYSRSGDLIAGNTQTTLGGFQIYLYDVNNDSLRLVTKTASGEPVNSLTSFVSTPLLADNGDILFPVNAFIPPSNTDLPGIQQGQNLFVYRAATDSLTRLNSGSAAHGISANGRVIVYQTGTNTSSRELRHLNLDTNVDQLITHAAGLPTTPANDRNFGTVSVSDDGCLVAYEARATDLVAGMVDNNGLNNEDTYLFDCSTGNNVLVSGVSGVSPPTTLAGSGTDRSRISGDGSRVIFRSISDGSLISGVTGPTQSATVGGGFSVRGYVFTRASGQLRMLDQVPGGTTSRGVETSLSLSRNGQRAAFTVPTGDLLTPPSSSINTNSYVLDLDLPGVQTITGPDEATPSDFGPGGDLLISGDGQTFAGSHSGTTFFPDDNNLGNDLYLRGLGNFISIPTQGGGGGNNAPTFSSPRPITGSEPGVALAQVGKAFTLDLTVSDPDAGDTLSVTAVSTLPAWLSLSPSGARAARLSGTPTQADVGTVPVTLRVSDGRGGSGTQSFDVRVEFPPEADRTPDDFEFEPQFDVAQNTLITSNTVTLTGFEAPATLSISGGAVKLNDAASFVTENITVRSGDRITVRHTSSDRAGVSVNTTVSIGNAKGIFTSATAGTGSESSVVDANGDGVTFQSTEGVITQLESREIPDEAERMGFQFPNGFFSFRIENLANGQSASITLTLPGGTGADTQLIKCVASGCFELPATVDVDNDTLTFTLTDGGPEDADGVANGTIVDPVGPAVGATTPVTFPAIQSAVDRLRSGSGNGCTLGRAQPGTVDPVLPALLVIAALYGLRRRRVH